ncbi:hypothetical protein BD626DRAFT_414560 [Schizophyllum amplum]|uniref:DNA breaking-rejoining enzyme n=1 Tax=Schizophyllum amplum TaxID=97359 RepID=A0A550BUH8_9AGAR|nr:hypothetical protein BD626DRAFT_414560 [Auriculariopsis ampla]
MPDAWAASTRARHPGQREAFLGYCEMEGVREDMRLPASEMLLCGYVAYLSGSMSGKAVRDKVNGVKAWHLLLNATWKGGEMLELALRGAQNNTPASSRQKKRPPITLEMLCMLVAKLRRDAMDAAIFYAACTAFYGQLRLGELLPASVKIERFDNSRNPCGRDIEVLNHHGSYALHLPYTKVAKGVGEEAVLTAQDGLICPVRALLQHLKLNAIGKDTPLASYIRGDGVRVALTSNVLLRRCNEVWAAEGLPRYTGHSFRIGGTTHLLLCGINPDVVRAAGRWSSSSFLRYWRAVPMLATLHIERRCGKLRRQDVRARKKLRKLARPQA